MESTETYRFKATTRYDEEACNALAFLMIRRLRKWPRMLMIATGLITVIASAAGMLYEGKVSAIGVILLFLGNVMCMFGFLAQRFSVKMMMAAYKKGEIPQNTYLFSEQKLRIQHEQTCVEYAYGDIGRVLEMSGYLFMFMTDGQMYLMRLQDVKGNLKAFYAFLEEKITQGRQAKG